MTVLELLQRASDLCARLKGRKVSVRSLQAYRDSFVRMWSEPELDALKPGCAMNTYYYRRAALHVAGAYMISDLSKTCCAAAERKDPAAAALWARVLKRALLRIEDAWNRDPPLAGGASPLKSPASRWRKAAGPDAKRRGASSKKYVLGLLPRDWDDRLWDVAQNEWNNPDDQQHIDALAVMLSVPVRPEDLVPRALPHGWSDGVTITLPLPHRLDIMVSPSKNHDGRYGTISTTVKINPTVAGGAAAYLAQRCAAAGGRMVVSMREKDHARRKLKSLGQIALPECDVTITPYVFREQIIADLKVTFGAGAVVAAAAGQGNDRTQAFYGCAQHGRKRRGFIGVECKRPPRTGNVARAHDLAATRKAATPKVKGNGSDN
jgi:hypothetical protein